MRIRIYILNGISEPVHLDEVEGSLEEVSRHISQLLTTHRLLMIEVKGT